MAREGMLVFSAADFEDLLCRDADMLPVMERRVESGDYASRGDVGRFADTDYNGPSSGQMNVYEE